MRILTAILGFVIILSGANLLEVRPEPVQLAQCDPLTCTPSSNCGCFDTRPPGNISSKRMPQFVMLTFDDAVNDINMDFYRELLAPGMRRNKAHGCNIAATFFVSADYLNYQHVYELYQAGSEIALHSITHLADHSYWRNLSRSGWEAEFLGEKELLVKYAHIPESELRGIRAPFLLIGGNSSHEMLTENGFLYDASIPYLRTSPQNPPIYPYTLDWGLRTPCTIPPCPSGFYKGLWTIPMNMLYSMRASGTGSQNLVCSMVDGCVPAPTTENDTFEYLKWNFDDYYEGNRAPFPMFMHEAWLKNPERKKGYLRFVDWLLEKEDVFVVTVSEVVKFMKNPKPVQDYRQSKCVRETTFNRCSTPHTCSYEHTIPGGPRIMQTCSQCPSNYPWLNR